MSRGPLRGTHVKEKAEEALGVMETWFYQRNEQYWKWQRFNKNGINIKMFYYLNIMKKITLKAKITMYCGMYGNKNIKVSRVKMAVFFL